MDKSMLQTKFFLNEIVIIKSGFYKGQKVKIVDVEETKDKQIIYTTEKINKDLRNKENMKINEVVLRKKWFFE